MDNKILEPSCPNCERLEGELFVEKDAAKKLEIHTRVIRQKLKEEITQLKSQLAMCKNTLEEISKQQTSSCIDARLALEKLKGDGV